MTVLTNLHEARRRDNATSNCGDEIRRRGKVSPQDEADRPSASQRTVGFVRRLALPVVAVDVAQPVSHRSDFDLYRDIREVLTSSDLPDCSNCWAIEILQERADDLGTPATRTAVLSPCGWITAMEDGDDCVISAVKLDLGALLGADRALIPRAAQPSSPLE